MGYIYKITNTITNKCYIGETKQSNPESRWKEHKNTIKNGTGCPALKDAVKKYGIENFKFDILLICFDEDRYKYEIEYIKKYNSQVPNGYNILGGGPGGGFEGKVWAFPKRSIASGISSIWLCRAIGTFGGRGGQG